MYTKVREGRITMDINANQCFVLAIVILYVSFLMVCSDLKLQISNYTKIMIGLSTLLFMIGVIIS